MKNTPMKAAKERKTLMIKIRVIVGQSEMLQAAADRANLDLSTWIRTIALKAAKEGERYLGPTQTVGPRF